MILTKRVSLYRDAEDNKGDTGQLSHILNAIKQGRYKPKVEPLRAYLVAGDKVSYDNEKRFLPAVTFSGQFEKRANDKLIPSTYTRIITIDLDKLELPAAEVARDIFEDKHCLAAWVSPSNNGVKALFLHDQDHTRHLDAFNHIKEYIEETFTLDVDPSGKDVARLCFVSYDPELEWREDATVFAIPERKVVEAKTKTWLNTERHKVSDDIDFTFQICQKWVSKNTDFASGGRNNFVFNLSCTLNRAGVDKEMAQLMILLNYPTGSDFTEQEVSTAVDSAYKKADEHGSFPVLKWATDNRVVRKANKSAMDDYSKLVYDRAYEMYSCNVHEAHWLPLVKFHWLSNKMNGHTIMDEAEFNRVISIAKRDVKDDTFETVKDSHPMSFKDAMEQTKERIFSGEFFTTLFPRFNADLGGGFRRGDVYGIVGPEGSFKSVYLDEVLGTNAMKGVPVLSNCMEMSAQQLIVRAVYRELGHDIEYKIKMGELDEKGYDEYISWLYQKYGENFFANFNIGMSCKDIAMHVAMLKERTGKEIGMIGIDGISSLAKVTGDEVGSLIENSLQLKELAKETNAAIIVLNHTNSATFKHYRNQDEFIRGGIKLRGNYDATINHSLIVNQQASNLDNKDYVYQTTSYCSRLRNKRGTGNITDVVAEVHQLRSIDTGFRFYDIEVKKE
jgi:KaiC/GvpD/RAD55 family RecA-like ATPase